MNVIKCVAFSNHYHLNWSYFTLMCDNYSASFLCVLFSFHVDCENKGFKFLGDCKKGLRKSTFKNHFCCFSGIIRFNFHNTILWLEASCQPMFFLGALIRLKIWMREEWKWKSGRDAENRFPISRRSFIELAGRTQNIIAIGTNLNCKQRLITPKWLRRKARMQKLKRFFYCLCKIFLSS